MTMTDFFLWVTNWLMSIIYGVAVAAAIYFIFGSLWSVQFVGNGIYVMRTGLIVIMVTSFFITFLFSFQTLRKTFGYKTGAKQ